MNCAFLVLLVCNWINVECSIFDAALLWYRKRLNNKFTTNIWFDITQSNDKQHGTRGFCARVLNPHNLSQFIHILRDSLFGLLYKFVCFSATSHINFIKWNTAQSMCVCMFVCTCVCICSNKLVNKKVTFCCFVAWKYAQIYVIRIRLFNASSIHNTFQKWQSYFACHLFRWSRISFTLNPFSFVFVACCVCRFTRFNLKFTLPIILFDKMPILYAVHSLFLCDGLSLFVSRFVLLYCYWKNQQLTRNIL